MKVMVQWFGVLLIPAFLTGTQFVFALDDKGSTSGSDAENLPALKQDACVRCHFELDADLDPEEQLFGHFRADIHVSLGFGCSDCHGGNPEAFDDQDAAMWDNKSFLGAPEKSDMPGFCGRCHSDPTFMRRYDPGAETDQVSQYFTSRHGFLLGQGKNKVACCTDCHGVHGIRAVSSPLSSVYPLQVPATCGKCHGDPEYMKEFGIPTNQLSEYSLGAHGKALLEKKDTGAPACNDCHGNHGAVPPEVDVIANVCGHCHVFNQQLFQQSALTGSFGKSKHPFCTVCHEKHKTAKTSAEFLNWSGASICKKCHEDGQEAQRVATNFYNILDSLRTQIAIADSLIERAETKGMEVSDLYANMEDARRALIKSRTNVHAFDEGILRETANEGQQVAQASVSGALGLLKQFRFRQRYLIYVTLIILFLVVVIWFKVKQLESTKKA